MDQSKENSKMKSFKTSLTEASKSQVVVSFGRMNPMTNGHEKLADKIKAEAKKRNADAKLYLSHSTNPKKDPLDFKTKVKFAKKAFGPMVQNSVARTIIEVAKELTGKYDDLIVVVGSDRIPEFKTLLNKYNGKDFTFKTIEVVSAGERDPDAEGVSGMSGSKMRGFVASDDFNSFKQGVPSKLSDSDAKALFDAVKRGMNLNEELEQQDENVLSFAQRRQRAQQFKRIQKRLVRARALQAKRFADPKRLKQRAVKMAYKFFRARLAGGKNYADLSTGEKIAVDTRLQKTLPAIRKFAVRLIPVARKNELLRKQHVSTTKEDVNNSFANFIVEKPTLPQDKDVKSKDGTQPKKYYVGLDKDTKDARASHFATTGPKSDSDPSAYKDAPGDKEAREKGMPQSKHTKKFKQMYGEAVDKKELSRLDMLVRMGLADKTLLGVIKRAISKLETGDTLSTQERTATNDLLSTLLDMVLSSDALFRMTKTQLQKESIQEAAYKGNIGMMEMMKFFEVASKEQKEKLKKLIADKNQTAAWKLIQDVTGMKLMGEEYDDSVEMDGISMAQIELASLVDDAEDVLDMMESMEEEPEQWVLSKITKATDYISSVRDYLEFENADDDEEEMPDDEYEDDEEDNDDELEAELMGMDPEDFGDAYEEFKPILEEIEGLKKKAEKSGISYGILKQVYNRGMAAWQGGHRPGTTPQQWAFARVNSFITKGKGTWGGADSDLASKVKSNEEFSKFAEALEWGTDAMRIAYSRETPGQSLEIITAKYSQETASNTVNEPATQRKYKVFDEEDECCDDCKDLEEKCWDTHKQVGMKKKGDKMVPDCVPKDSVAEENEILEEVDWESILVEADYQGKTVTLNNPFRTPDGPKKFGVYTMGPNGNVVIVRFGDPNMEIKRDDPERRASFRARHGCDNPGPKWKAKYWSCYQWRAGAKVDS
jgi:hypothetical protein